jgi:transcriptional regulator with XRE-family HTH domain
MKTDHEVRRMRNERHKGKTQEQAAARAGMSVRTARKYERLAQLPSQLKKPRARTRPNPFAQDWPWVQAQLERDSALQVKTLFDELCLRFPGRYQPIQLRTLQRHVAFWRAQEGPARAVIFEQVHQPGRLGQSDFTHMDDLSITLAGVPFPHLLYHFVLTYSNVEAVHLCFSESFEALAEGLEGCLWQLGGVPAQHRTDNLSAAVVRIERSGERHYTERYQALMAHYHMQPSTNTPGEAHENGDVEQSHFRFKDALDQALRLRGSREFASRAAYLRFVSDLVRLRNHTRQVRWVEERERLSPLPTMPLDPAQELRVTVSRFSTIRILRNTYSVPSRLIGHTLTVRVRAEVLELYLGATRLETLPRVRGQHQQQINYRHLIDSLVRKPGAFAQYRYHDALFPSLLFRQAYDCLCHSHPQRADQHYLRILHLAASGSETEVETALALLLEVGTPPTYEAVRTLVHPCERPALPQLSSGVVDLSLYDQLLGDGRRYEQPIY